MKARKEEKSSLCGVLMVLVAIAVGVAGIVYALSTHRRHVNQEKWKDYDECGLVKGKHWQFFKHKSRFVPEYFSMEV